MSREKIERISIFSTVSGPEGLLAFPQAEGFSAFLQGVPSHQKWFWTSRGVYMAVEPAYFHVMSGGRSTPDVLHAGTALLAFFTMLSMSGGICSAHHTNKKSLFL